MVSSSALLRNIRPSGGLFTENILLRLRDNPEQLKIGKIESFLSKDTKEARRQFKENRRAVFDWCVQKWDEISTNIEKWNSDELAKKWLIPFFTQFGYIIENFQIKRENIDADSSLRNFKINHQSKDHNDPFFHFVNNNEDFDSKIDDNPQKKSHHNICQYFVNFNPEIKWLFLTNGRLLRILTKYYHSYSKGFLEFDIENIFANRDEKEFYVLYSTIHASRFAVEDKDHEFLIDIFKKDSSSEGIKIGDALRGNVHEALELLGNELIQENSEFLEIIRNNKIDLTDYYAELLRIIYRIIFILYAEQRGMLPEAGTIYFEQFSLSSLRILAEKPIKIEKSYDLWNKLFILFRLIKEGNNLLQVPCYNGSLFKEENLLIILSNKLKISNPSLLRIIKLLTTSIDFSVRQRINFLEIREEEIGAIYESLLDYKPYFSSNLQFQLIEGTERKSTGSYYTPKELIDILIRTTLQPLIDDRLEKAGEEIGKKEKAILDIKVCDPACGGGTFLLAAIDFLGKELAEIKTGSDSPMENDLRDARREILQHCIYGIDMNPLAVELCKMSLWLRACVKDKPLNFLDNHIKCGNSLIGLGQKMEINEINPDAFEAISGNKATGILPENKKLKNKAQEVIKKEINERKKKGKATLITSFFTEKRTADICSAKFKEIIDMPETDSNKIKEKEQKYDEIRKNEKYQQALNEANIWTSTFFWSFEGDTLGEIPRYTTIEQLKDKIADPELDNLIDKIKEISKENQFFHWYIEFPEVFSTDRDGFDCVLTNPPWETLDLKEMEFFATVEEIINAKNQSIRRNFIKKLKNKNVSLYLNYKEAFTKIYKINHFLKTSGLYKLTSSGHISTYSVFAERCWNLLNKEGKSGIILPIGIVMNYYTQEFFRELLITNSINFLFDFENKKKIFDIHSSFRFCLLSLSARNKIEKIIPMAFYQIDPIEIQNLLETLLNSDLNLEKYIDELPIEHYLIPFKKSDFLSFNPNTETCLSVRNKRDLILLRKMYSEGEVLINRDVESEEIINNPWKIELKRLFDSADDSHIFKTQEQLEKLGFYPQDRRSLGGIWINDAEEKYYPLYEGRMIWYYDHRFNSVEFADIGLKRKARSRKTTEKEYCNKYFCAIPNYWVRKKDILDKLGKAEKDDWFLIFRLITGTTNERTFILSVIPFSAIARSTPRIISGNNPEDLCLLYSNLASIVFDYITRLKLYNNDLTNFVIEQLPIIPPNKYNTSLKKKIINKVLKLTFNTYSLKNFAKDIGYDDEPFEWNYNERIKLQAELDAIYAHLYKLDKDELIYILDTFPVLKRKELEKLKEFKTKSLILEAYDKFSLQKELFE